MSCKNCPTMSKTFQNHVSGGWMGVHIFEAKTINNPKIPFTQFTPVKLVDTRAAILSEIAPSRTESFLLHYACVFGQLLQKNTSIGRVMRCRTVPSLLFCRPVQEWNCPWSYLPHPDFARAIRLRVLVLLWIAAKPLGQNVSNFNLQIHAGLKISVIFKPKLLPWLGVCAAEGWLGSRIHQPGADVGASAGSIYMRIPDPAPLRNERDNQGSLNVPSKHHLWVLGISLRHISTI